ncbi:MAG: 6-bladed beta-propeller [Gammaproteobacteria bacterium]|nr:MAG: 6-bladed beta-propeller [Gammaproteobacteria bacterium]
MIRSWPLLIVLTISACATSKPEPGTLPGEALSIVWPGAPEPARIEFIAMFSKAEDLGWRKSFFYKMREFLAGSEDRRMLRPYAVVAGSDVIAVADPGAAVVHLFDTQRRSYSKLSQAGKTRLLSPVGVALGNDRLFVADSELNKVFILDRSSRLLLTLEDFQRPTGLAFDPRQQRLYVADTLAHEVRVFDLNGDPLFTIGKRGEQDGQFNFPSHLAFTGDRLFVTDTMNFRIQIFSRDGEYLKTFGKHGDGSGYFAQPKGVAVDSDGHVYVADALANRVQIFTEDGEFLLSFGGEGDKPGAFNLPAGLAIRGNRIYVADSYNRRIQMFRYLPEEN